MDPNDFRQRKLFLEAPQLLKSFSRNLALTTTLFAVAYFGYLGLEAHSGLGLLWDLSIFTVFGVLAIALLGGTTLVLHQVFGLTTRLVLVGIAGGWLAIFLAPSVFGFENTKINDFVNQSLILGSLSTSLGLVALKEVTKSNSNFLRRLLAAGILATIILSTFYIFKSKVQIPSGNPANSFSQSANPSLTLSGDDLQKPGKYLVKKAHYGVGNSRRRQEFGTNVQVKTLPVDASFFGGARTSKMDSLFRNWYWGFDHDTLPLNGQIWIPQGAGRSPLVLIVHGSHVMTKNSDDGFDYLARHLASHGFLVVSIDQNFLNPQSYFFRQPNVRDLRAWLILKHLELWRTWSNQPGHTFSSLADLSQIALIGHSIGGDATLKASFYNNLHSYPANGNIRFKFHFSIKALVGLAPFSPLKTEWSLENISYLALHGSHDGDLNQFAGLRNFSRISLTKDGPFSFKSTLFIKRANHSQFNTAWSSNDGLPIERLFQNQKALLSGPDQQLITKIYTLAFLKATLLKDTGLLPIFGDYRTIQSSLPQTLYFSQYEDSRFRTLEDFNRPMVFQSPPQKNWAEITHTGMEKILTTPVGPEMNPPDSALLFSWKKSDTTQQVLPRSSIRLRIPETWFRNNFDADLPPTHFFLSVGIATTSTPNSLSKYQPPNFSIQLYGKKNRALGSLSFKRVYQLPPQTFDQLSPFNLHTETPLQTVTIPQSSFESYDNPKFSFLEVENIEFRFDEAPDGSMAIDNVGFASSSKLNRNSP